MGIRTDLYSTARIIPVQRANRVRSITKLANEDLSVTQHGGNSFVISKDDELFQTFLVYMVLNEDA